ncbi:hypothetical protein [Marinomonas arenicola]|uniref:Uncharacterized protein n=1 Tax=Marinomonas arenicola TaxID=569601 RepID=A0ABU9G8S7_9GAMM
MNDNLIPFPNIKRVINVPSEEATCNSELVELREAFDRARKQWPIEIAELPEENKIYSHNKK